MISVIFSGLASYHHDDVVQPHSRYSRHGHTKIPVQRRKIFVVETTAGRFLTLNILLNDERHLMRLGPKIVLADSPKSPLIHAHLS